MVGTGRARWDDDALVLDRLVTPSLAALGGSVAAPLLKLLLAARRADTRMVHVEAPEGWGPLLQRARFVRTSPDRWSSAPELLRPGFCDMPPQAPYQRRVVDQSGPLRAEAGAAWVVLRGALQTRKRLLGPGDVWRPADSEARASTRTVDLMRCRRSTQRPAKRQTRIRVDRRTPGQDRSRAVLKRLVGLVSDVSATGGQVPLNVGWAAARIGATEGEVRRAVKVAGLGHRFIAE